MKLSRVPRRSTQMPLCAQTGMHLWIGNSLHRRATSRPEPRRAAVLLATRRNPDAPMSPVEQRVWDSAVATSKEALGTASYGSRREGRLLADTRCNSVRAAGRATDSSKLVRWSSGPVGRTARAQELPAIAGGDVPEREVVFHRSPRRLAPLVVKELAVRHDAARRLPATVAVRGPGDNEAEMARRPDHRRSATVAAPGWTMAVLQRVRHACGASTRR